VLGGRVAADAQRAFPLRSPPSVMIDADGVTYSDGQSSYRSDGIPLCPTALAWSRVCSASCSVVTT
jgi:hypothetical protein